MASKKYILVMSLLGLMQTASFAQSSPGSASDAYVNDSSKVRTKNAPQFNDFQKNIYPYPAKPKSQLEIGGGIGNGFVLGGRPIFSTGYNGGITGNVSVRKAISHLFSIRAGYSGSMTTIPHEANADFYFTSSRNQTHSANLDFIVSLSTLSPYRGNPKTNVYLFTGYDLVATYVKTQHLTGGVFSYNNYYYNTRSSITTFGGTAVNGIKDWHLLHAYSLGGGIAFKLNEKFNLGFEERVMVPFAFNDNLNGNPNHVSSPSAPRPQLDAPNEKWSYSTVRLNMNIGSLATHVAPLWWINPNNYVYSELNKPSHLKITPLLPDADGDGVTDQFDLEPNTPAGAPVDTHGRAKDTDGDGVPDYRDKEILTPQNCFPVNADGVGTCPEPACCKELRDKLKEIEDLEGTTRNACNLTSLPSIAFKPGSYKLSKEAQALLATAAGQLKANAKCNVKAVGYVTDATKKAQQLSWDRVNAIIKYLVEKQGIQEGRIIFSYDTTGPSNSVDLIPTKETGPNTVPAPAPNLRSNK